MERILGLDSTGQRNRSSSGTAVEYDSDLVEEMKEKQKAKTAFWFLYSRKVLCLLQNTIRVPEWTLF
jgi:hypothetical protein